MKSALSWIKIRRWVVILCHCLLSSFLFLSFLLSQEWINEFAIECTLIQCQQNSCRLSRWCRRRQSSSWILELLMPSFRFIWRCILVLSCFDSYFLFDLRVVLLSTMFVESACRFLPRLFLYESILCTSETQKTSTVLLKRGVVVQVTFVLLLFLQNRKRRKSLHQ